MDLFLLGVSAVDIFIWSGVLVNVQEFVLIFNDCCYEFYV